MIFLGMLTSPLLAVLLAGKNHTWARLFLRPNSPNLRQSSFASLPWRGSLSCSVLPIALCSCGVSLCVVSEVLFLFSSRLFVLFG